MPLPPSKFKCSILPKIFLCSLHPPGTSYIFIPPPTPFPSPSSFYIPLINAHLPHLYIPPYPHLSPFYLIFIFPPPPPEGGLDLWISEFFWFWFFWFFQNWFFGFFPGLFFCFFQDWFSWFFQDCFFCFFQDWFFWCLGNWFF